MQRGRMRSVVAEVKKKVLRSQAAGREGEEPTIGCHCSSTGAEGNARAALFDGDPLEVVRE